MNIIEWLKIELGSERIEFFQPDRTGSGKKNPVSRTGLDPDLKICLDNYLTGQKVVIHPNIYAAGMAHVCRRYGANYVEPLL